MAIKFITNNRQITTYFLFLLWYYIKKGEFVVVFLYFLLFIIVCVLLGIFNAFIIMPILEKKEMQKIVSFVKNIVFSIIDIFLCLFIIYVFFATLTVTTDLLNKELHINNSGILALIIICICIYGYIKRYMYYNKKK